MLQRDFTALAPDRVWVADTTYLPVLAGFIYLVVVIDFFSRKVVGWTVGDRLDASLSSEALQRAFTKRRPDPGDDASWRRQGARGDALAAARREIVQPARLRTTGAGISTRSHRRSRLRFSPRAPPERLETSARAQ